MSFSEGQRVGYYAPSGRYHSGTVSYAPGTGASLPTRVIVVFDCAEDVECGVEPGELFLLLPSEPGTPTECCLST